MSNFSPALTWIYQPPLHTMWILHFVAVFVSLLRTSYSCTSLDFHQNYAFIEDWKHSRLNHCQSCPISSNVRGTAGARPGARQCLITLPKADLCFLICYRRKDSWKFSVNRSVMNHMAVWSDKLRFSFQHVYCKTDKDRKLVAGILHL